MNRLLGLERDPGAQAYALAGVDVTFAGDWMDTELTGLRPESDS